MQAEIIFDTDGEQFQENGIGEVFRILTDIKESLMRGNNTGRIEDDYGNNIGRWSLELPR